MDTTEEYIEMSKALPDAMLDAWEAHAGDFVFAKHGFSDYDYRKELDNGILGIITEVQEGVFSIRLCGEDGAAAWYSIEHSIPLWRQDQLQNMIDYIPSLLNIDELHDAYQLYGGQSKTMEQLWLTFVMYEKYGLKWSSEQKGWI